MKLREPAKSVGQRRTLEAQFYAGPSQLRGTQAHYNVYIDYVEDVKSSVHDTNTTRGVQRHLASSSANSDFGSALPRLRNKHYPPRPKQWLPSHEGKETTQTPPVCWYHNPEGPHMRTRCQYQTSPRKPRMTRYEYRAGMYKPTCDAPPNRTYIMETCSMISSAD